MKKEDEIPIETRVKLSKSGLIDYGHQSKGGEGTIISYHDHKDYRYRIRWDNGNSTVYRYSDIEIIDNNIMIQIF